MPAPPLILLTNDDGLGSPGLRAAAEAVADLGELLVFAPATQPAGVSVLNLNVPRSATTRTELRKTVQGQHPYYVRRRPGSPRPLDQPYQFAVEVGIDPDRLEPGTDIHAIVRDGVASVTPLTRRQTAATDWTPAQEG